MIGKCGHPCPNNKKACNAVSFEACLINTSYKMCKCNMEKEYKDLLFFMGLGEGEEFVLKASNSNGVIFAIGNTERKIAINRSEAKKLFAYKI